MHRPLRIRLRAGACAASLKFTAESEDLTTPCSSTLSIPSHAIMVPSRCICSMGEHVCEAAAAKTRVEGNLSKIIIYMIGKTKISEIAVKAELASFTHEIEPGNSEAFRRTSPGAVGQRKPPMQIEFSRRSAVRRGRCRCCHACNRPLRRVLHVCTGSGRSPPCYWSCSPTATLLVLRSKI